MTEDDRLDGGAPDDETVVVPMRLYKTVTVFSTLVATVLVVFGFFFFDAATHSSNPIRETVVWVIGLSGWTPPAEAVGTGFGLLGVGFILLGAGSYILGTRFKTAEMVGSDDGGDGEPDVNTADEEPDGGSSDDQSDGQTGDILPDRGSDDETPGAVTDDAS